MKNRNNQINLNPEHPQKLIRIRKVILLTGLSKSYIYELCNKNIFPKQIHLVPGGTSVAWVEKEVLDWCQSRIQERDDKEAHS